MARVNSRDHYGLSGTEVNCEKSKQGRVDKMKLRQVGGVCLNNSAICKNVIA